MDRMIINARNANGRPYQFKIQHGASGSINFIVSQDDAVIGTKAHLTDARDLVEKTIKGLKAHMDDIIQQDGDASWAIAFRRQDDDTVIIETLEWMSGRYVKLGPDVKYAVDCAAYEYGYC